MVHRCLVVLRDYARKCSELAWDCRGFCKRWQQKWFLSASSSWDYAGEDWSLSFGRLARLMLGYGRHVLCRWSRVQAKRPNACEKLFYPSGRCTVGCSRHAGFLLSEPRVSDAWNPGLVRVGEAETMVAQPRREQRSSPTLGKALVAALWCWLVKVCDYFRLRGLQTALARILHGSTFRTRLQVTKATAGSLRTCRSRHVG